MGIKPGVSNAPIPSPQPKGGYENLPGQALDPRQGAVVEGNIMDVTQRIKYNDKEGHWEVIFNGKVITKAFKTSGEAFQYLADLKSGKEKA